MTFQPGQVANPRGGQREPNLVERLLSEQLRIVAREVVKVPVEEADGKGKALSPNSKAYKRKKNRERAKQFRQVMKMRAVAEKAFELAIKGNLDAMNFIAEGNHGAYGAHGGQRRIFYRTPNARAHCPKGL
jgi:hypothetical protein